MKPIFANPTPIDISYDSEGDALYLTFSRDETARTVELLADWPMLLVDLNAEAQIVGIEYVGAKQFGVATLAELLRERVRRAFGIEVAAEEVEAFTHFMRSPEAQVALAS